MIAESRSLGHINFSAIVVFMIGLGMFGAWPMPGSCDPSAEGFCDPQAVGGEFAHCITLSIAMGTGKRPLNQIISQEPIRGYLQTLANRPGYRGEAGDLDELKQFSSELKRDPNGNQEAIATLDDAIASYADEIRTALSVSRLAASERPGTDVYPLFVRQKLDFLGSNRAKFYDKGPFEITVRSLFASALEADFFLDQAAGSPDSAKLELEITVLDEVLQRRQNAQYQYLSNEQAKSEINSDSYWRASLLFALGRRNELRAVLHDLIMANADFSVEPANAKQIYINRVFNLPYKILAQEGSDPDGSPKFLATDPWLLKRFYNAAQLALFTCALLEDAGLKNIQKFVDVITDMSLNDYFVVAASGSDYAKAEKLRQAIMQTLDGQLESKTNETLNQINYEEVVEVVEKMKRGKKLCNIDDNVGIKIFSPFKFEPKLLNLKSREQENYGVIFGGNVNVTQARTIARFLNEKVFATPDAAAARKALGREEGAYVARIRIED